MSGDLAGRFFVPEPWILSIETILSAEGGMLDKLPKALKSSGLSSMHERDYGGGVRRQRP